MKGRGEREEDLVTDNHRDASRLGPLLRAVVRLLSSPSPLLPLLPGTLGSGAVKSRDFSAPSGTKLALSTSRSMAATQ